MNIRSLIYKLSDVLPAHELVKLFCELCVCEANRDYLVDLAQKYDDFADNPSFAGFVDWFLYGGSEPAYWEVNGVTYKE